MISNMIILREWSYSDEISLWELFNSPKFNIQDPLIDFWNLKNAKRKSDFTGLPCLNSVALCLTFNSLAKSNWISSLLSENLIIDKFDLDLCLSSQLSLNKLSNCHGCTPSVLIWGSLDDISPGVLEKFPDEGKLRIHHLWGLQIHFLVLNLAHGVLFNIVLWQIESYGEVPDLIKIVNTIRRFW